MSRSKAKDRAALEDRIGYKFADKALLERALTHISALSGGNRANSYQRLEFLGDHVLGLVISDLLYRAFPRANEGEMSRRLSDLVRKETCAEVARAMDLGPALKLGSSENNAGGRLRTTILGDACEALVGAVFLDGGYAAADDSSCASGATACRSRCARCAIPRPCCRNGRRRAGCRRRPTRKWRAPARITSRNST